MKKKVIVLGSSVGLSSAWMTCDLSVYRIQVFYLFFSCKLQIYFSVIPGHRWGLSSIHKAYLCGLRPLEPG